jgi:microcystin-dependent protein
MLAAGGVEKYTLNATHLPAHSHTTSVGNDNTDHYHGIPADIGSGGSPVVAAFGSNLARAGNYASGGRSAYHQHTVIVNSSTGGDQPHPIMQPCIIVLKIIKL